MTPNYEEFRRAWLEDVLESNPNPIEKGRRFAQKLMRDWLDIDSDSLDITYCDGSGDGGIDVAVLERGATNADDAASDGDTWYLVQSKYGRAFSGENTLIEEGRKIIDTLAGNRSSLSSLSEAIVEKVSNFRRRAVDGDRIVILFATVDPLNETERRALDDVRTLGRKSVGALFEVASVSVRDVFDSLQEEEALAAKRRLTVPLRGHLANAGADLLVGSVTLTDLYSFLKTFRSMTGNLDQLYEKNVRRFLGGRVKVNKGMQSTLRNEPERFGLYNNGVTIVVSDFRNAGSGAYELVEPYVVNGCQTTKTIWEIADRLIGAGGSGADDGLDQWRLRAESGCVVVKVAKVGAEGEAMLQAITRYTNSQNAVRDKDFIALDKDFRAWASTLAREFDLYLETQRGGWDSQLAFQRQNPSSKQFVRNANSLDLMKIYGAGWLSRPGIAFGKNPPFLPGGAVFKEAMERADGDDPFGARDLFAAYLLLKAGQELGFGRGGPAARRQTKFVFYYVFINFLKDILRREEMQCRNSDVSSATIRLLRDQNDGANALKEAAAQLIDTYMLDSEENCVQKESAFKNDFAYDLNAFLKWERLGRDLDETQNLRDALVVQKQFLNKRFAGNPSIREQVSAVLQSE